MWTVQDLDWVEFWKGIKYVYVDDSMDDICEILILFEWKGMNSNSVGMEWQIPILLES